MTSSVIAAAVAMAAAAAVFGQTQTPPVFRAASDIVAVDVAVRINGTPVGALKASDFVLLDNGVPQQIESVEMERVPVEITILVETSSNMADYIDSLDGQVQKIAALARPDDLLRVVTMDTDVREMFPMQRAATHPLIARLTERGLASVNDGLAATLIRGAESNRRHLVIALTDTIDTVSTLGAEAIREIARQSSATLHIAWITMAFDPPHWTSSRERLGAHKCGATGQCLGTRRFWEPFYDHTDQIEAVMREAAALTGGKLHEPGVFVGRTASAVFKSVYDDYRQSYLLRYTPQGVKREGWHQITVSIPSHREYSVTARRGYSIDGAEPRAWGGTPAPAASAPARPTAASASLEEVIAAYGRADYAAALDTVRRSPDRARLIRDFRAAGNPWPATPARESVLVLELAETGFRTDRPDARDASRALLLAHNRLVRAPLEPDEFERQWLFAELALVQGIIQPSVGQTVAANALKRFPEEPRFVLANAIIANQFWPAGSFEGFTPNRSVPRSADVIAAYDEASKYESTFFEAHVRKSWFQHRLGLNEAALEALDSAGPSSVDPLLNYNRQFFRAQVLESLARRPEAIDAYRAALAIVPTAQSARVGLMNALVRSGDRAGAAALAEEIQTAPASQVDPWWIYWQGDFRFYGAAIARLREYLQ